MAMRIMIVAGEPSGDGLGGRLMAALTELTGGDVAFTGVGGEAMAAQGLVSLFPMAELSVMGFAEVLPRIPLLLRRIRQTAAAALGARPEALVTIDSPAFTLRVAKRLAGRGIPLVHYVAPQVWAWRPGRAREVARFLDHMLALFPFEPPYFEAHGLSCSFVGHPVIESGAGGGDGAAFRSRHGLAPEAKLLAVLPGSRPSETARHLPPFAEALRRLQARFPGLHAVVPTLPPLAREVGAAARAWALPTIVIADEAEKFDAFAAAEAALAASGTVTLELALARVPTVVAYKTHPLTGWLARRLVTVDHVALPNLILGRPVMPELLLGECRGDLLAQAVGEILVDRAARDEQIGAMAALPAALGAGGERPSRRAAREVLEAIERGPRRRLG